jgi:large subunit ribosomal protein L20
VLAEFMNKLKIKGIELDRKVLADLAMNNPASFKELVNSVK